MRAARVSALAIVCALSLAGSVLGDGHLLPGQSRHGEAFDRGPRWSAYLMGGTGDVHFPVTSKNPLVQKFIEQGVGQLHGFWYVEAERSFRQAATLDPNCGIAYWGMAMANRSHKPRAAVGAGSRPAQSRTDRPRADVHRRPVERGWLSGDHRQVSQRPGGQGFRGLADMAQGRIDHPSAARIGGRAEIGPRDPARRSDAPHPSRRDPHRRCDQLAGRRARLGGQMRTQRPVDRPHVAHADPSLLQTDARPGGRLVHGSVDADRACPHDARPRSSRPGRLVRAQQRMAGAHALITRPRARCAASPRR